MLCDGLVARLKRGESIVVAEGYIFELERRGYLAAGPFVPEVVLEHPEVVKSLHEEFVRAGSDVVLALTYYGHREKLKVIGRDGDLERLNRQALRIARAVADETGTLMAGNICNTTIYNRDDPESVKVVEEMFKDQIQWAVEEGADFMVAETFNDFGEAMLALKTIQKYGKGLPATVSLTPLAEDQTYDGVPIGEACRRLEEAGAAVVGLNCGKGPTNILRPLRKVREACKGPIMALPVAYSTTDDKNPTLLSFKNEKTGTRAFPLDLPAFQCTRTEVAQFTREARALGVQYLGICCGNASHYLRVLAEECGRTPPASRFSPRMELHYVYGSYKAKDDSYYTQGLRSAKLGTS
ncbi:betaine--homocysteine S-methyltransferase 1-like isoform X2 [Babylonia areolata]|uniref:betaine--homocysteine S-methyltransferase 1-like isoform X2 n=1 Tax=Babylonia areolata TaxID=304850 RepID=UPI003FCF5AFD